MKRNLILFCLGLVLIFSGCFNDSRTGEDRVFSSIDDLMAKMTLEEKIGQMNLYSSFWSLTGPAPIGGDAKMKYDHLKNGQLGAVLNVHGVEDARKWQEMAVNETRLGIPLLFGYDVIHGHKTLAPIPLAESCSWNLDLMKKSAAMAAREASAMGINWTFAPMVDISRDARWGRVMEGAGEDPFLGSLIAKARVEGFQGDDLSAPHTIAATAKHFAGYGFAESGKDYNTADVGLNTLHNMILPPFKAAAESDVKTFMNSFNTLNGIPATADEFLQRDLLKEKWNYPGFIVSDWGSGAEMIAHGYAKDMDEVAELSANAGSDMDMESYAFVNHLQKAVEDGAVPMEYIDDAVKRILEVKEDLGLFEDPYKYCNEEREKTDVFSAQNRADALAMAKESIVLLKNEKNMLPLDPDKKVALIGALADDDNSPLGNWRLGSDNFTGVTLKEGMESLSTKVDFEKGPDYFSGDAMFHMHINVNEDNKKGLDEAIALARNAEKVVLVMGEHGFQSGEGRSRGNIGLPGFQQEMLSAIYAVNPNIVLVVMSGRPLDLSWADANLPAVLACWQLGTETGNAIAEVLYGKTVPSGKLTMTFPRSVSQVPIYYNYLNTGRPGPKNEVFWSHYSDMSNEPLYPFGFGLSYTSFEYGKAKITNAKGKTTSLSLEVTNTGEFDAKEIVQLYIRDLVARPARPIKELKGFEKIELKAGESKTINFTLDESNLGSFNDNGDWKTEAGDFHIMVGPNSRDLQILEFELE
ncbi:MAG: beta-glucosidase BglX [Bacteroidota bacterium]